MSTLAKTNKKGKTCRKDKSKLYTKKLKAKFSMISPTSTTKVEPSKEAVDSNPGKLCNIAATYQHVLEVQKTLPKKDFEKYVSKLKCFKYKEAPKNFVIKRNHDKKIRRKISKKWTRMPSTESRLKWDWIRNKRSLQSEEDSVTIINRSKNENHNEKKTIEKHGKYNDKLKLLNYVNFVTDDNDSFEAFFKDEFGIYRSRKRHKRTAGGIQQLAAMLKDLPFSGRTNETYAHLGDSVIIHCAVRRSLNVRNVTWKTDRSQMLEFDNVAVDGPRVLIKNVAYDNMGVYVCQRGNSQRNVKLTVITLPTYKVIVTPVYYMKRRCFYDDLKAIQTLGSAMGKEVCSEDQICSVTVEEPICLEDRLDTSTYIRATAVLTLAPREGIQCSSRCRRDLHNSLAFLAAVNAPVLASVEVVISSDVENKTLVPTWSGRSKEAIVTHTLRRKDAVLQDLRYHVDLPPGSVGLVSLCPSGYYLISGQKICAACPIGSWSNAGDNTCSATTAPHSNDKQGPRFRRCQWLWYTGYGYCAAWWGAACACAGAVALAHARRPRERPQRERGGAPEGGARARPLSPSRVILAKFFGSRSCTKATDPQETKFGLWKGQHSPPPLPPIDFDL